MFTGIVEQMGEVKSAGTRLAVSTPLAAQLERVYGRNSIPAARL